MICPQDPRLPNQEPGLSDLNRRPLLDSSDEGEDKSVDSSDEELYHSDFSNKDEPDLSDNDEPDDSSDKDKPDDFIESILESIAQLFI